MAVLSGSLPPGLPTDAYARLIRTAAAAGVVTVLDTSGPALVEALRASPDVVKPNADGLYAITPQGLWRAAPPERLSGNPAGTRGATPTRP